MIQEEQKVKRNPSNNEGSLFDEILDNKTFCSRFANFSQLAIKEELNKVSDEALYEFWNQLIAYAERSKTLEVKPKPDPNDKFAEYHIDTSCFDLGSKRFHAKYNAIYKVLDREILDRRLKKLMSADTFNGSNNAVQQNFEQQKKFLNKMIEMTGSKNKYAGEIVRGEYKMDKWELKFYVEYWTLPMPHWKNLFPAFTIGISYGNETGIMVMNQFAVVQPLLSEIFCLLNHASEVVFQ